MKKFIRINGYGYSLRPVEVNDAEFIIKTRLEDEKRNIYLHKISENRDLQVEWINKYLEKDDEYYFVVENNLTGDQEGLIGLYKIFKNEAEWGRWAIRKNSLASIESVDLIFKVAFLELGLDKVYCRTIFDNKSVISFHDSISEKRRHIVRNCFYINDKFYDAIEHVVDKDLYQKSIQYKLEEKSSGILTRNMNSLVGNFTFHHIGVATNNIEKEFNTYKLLGYSRESNVFIDESQGIKGLFIIAKNQPRLELLENLGNSKTLNIWLDRKNKMYHFAYFVNNIGKAIEIFLKNNAKVISVPKKSVYFNSNICFLVLNNFYIIELIEKID